ncbi:hypothetical protein ONZ51_g693 [Trametes cubensis]|uniref:Uncharacterized protein n=1 Tax=Trametes cubensis TaxID=1111947 RepID=A0AAD7XIF0_9APHY|nr:hypothetical protein ONZ51_g693 [Trametes cubensis]
MSNASNASTTPSADASASAAMPPPPLPLPAPTDAATTASASPLSDIQTLRNHIQTLSDLNNRLQALRHIPALLLRPPTTGVHALPQASLLRHEFQEIKDITEAIRSDKVQDALKAARKSEAAEPKLLGFDIRRDNLKRRHVLHASQTYHFSSEQLSATPCGASSCPDDPHHLNPLNRTARRSPGAAHFFLVETIARRLSVWAD